MVECLFSWIFLIFYFVDCMVFIYLFDQRIKKKKKILLISIQTNKLTTKKLIGFKLQELIVNSFLVNQQKDLSILFML